MKPFSAMLCLVTALCSEDVIACWEMMKENVISSGRIPLH